MSDQAPLKGPGRGEASASLRALTSPPLALPAATGVGEQVGILAETLVVLPSPS